MCLIFKILKMSMSMILSALMWLELSFNLLILLYFKLGIFIIFSILCLILHLSISFLILHQKELASEYIKIKS